MRLYVISNTDVHFCSLLHHWFRAARSKYQTITVYIMTQKNEVSVAWCLRVFRFISTYDTGNTLVILLMEQIIHPLILGKLPSIYGIFISLLLIMIINMTVTVSFLYISKLFCLRFFPPIFRRSFQKATGQRRCLWGRTWWHGIPWLEHMQKKLVFFFEMGGGGKYCLNDIRYITFSKTKGPQRTVTWCKVPVFYISGKMSGLFDITCG